MFYSVDEVIKSLKDQASDLESYDNESKDAEALRVAVKLLSEFLLPRNERAQVLPLETLHVGWERLWLQLYDMVDGGDVMVSGRNGSTWKLESAGCLFILDGGQYNRRWRVWSSPPTVKDMTDRPWEEETK